MDICCFHLLATMNHAAVNIGGQVSVKVIFSVLSGLSLGVELLGHVVALTCWKMAKISPEQMHSVTFPPAVYKGSGFSTSS